MFTLGRGLVVAIFFFACALPVVRAADDTEPPGLHVQSGEQAFKAGRFKVAVEAWEQAARRYSEGGDVIGHARSLMNKGIAELVLGNYGDAITSLERARSLAEPSGDRDLVARIDGNLGNGYWLVGREAQAKVLLDRSVDRGGPEVAASALNNLGNLIATSGKLDEAIAFYERGLELAERSKGNLLAVNLSINLARTLQRKERYDEADAHLEVAMRRVRDLGDSHDKAYALISIGDVYAPGQEDEARTRPGTRLQAHDAFTRAIGVAEAIGDMPALSYGLGYLGGLYEREGRYAEAMQLTNRAIFAGQQANASTIVYRWDWQVGRLLAQQGKVAQAIAAYERAIGTLETVKREAGLVQHRSDGESFGKIVGSIYFEQADLLLQQASRSIDAAKRQNFLRQARRTVELLKGAELENYFQDDCVARLRARTKDLDKVVTARSAALYPIILQDRVEILMSLSNELKQFTVPVDAETLVEEVRAFRNRLEKRTTHQYLPHAKTLYDWLIQPLESELQSRDIDTLVIVPDGALRTIPLAALHDGKEFLVSRYAIATTPGLSLTDPRPLEQQSARILLNGLTQSVQGFPELPHVSEELSRVSELYRGTVLENQRFSSSNVEAELEETPYSIVHIASHGQFDADPQKTFLLTYDGKLNMDDLEQFMGLATFRPNPVELLTLSACQTAAGDDRAALGLAGVAVKAGARSALASLWFINDRASSLLVSEFYRQLQNPTLSKARALQRAQLELLGDPGRRYRHPIFWSPFLLIGNWL